MHLPGRLDQRAGRVGAVLRLAGKKFFKIDGVEWAGAFAFNAFFALFPLMVLLVTIASSFVDRNRAGEEIITYMESHVPITSQMQQYISDTIAGVFTARKQAGVVATFALVWAALQCFITLIKATNRAWGVEVQSLWRLPLKGLALLGITAVAVLLGMAAPVMSKMAMEWIFPIHGFRSWMYELGSFFIPLTLMFFGLSVFYRLAPRKPARFVQVWAGALCATALLKAAESLFVVYLRNFATFNAVYGTFGGIMAMLLWIYLSGCIFIFGACLCAAYPRRHSVPEQG